MIGIHVSPAEFDYVSDDAPAIPVSNYAVRITEDIWSEIKSWMETYEEEPGTQEIDQLFYEFEDDSDEEDNEKIEEKVKSREEIRR